MGQEAKHQADRINELVTAAADAARTMASRIRDIINEGVMDPELLIAADGTADDLDTAASDIDDLTLDLDEY